MREIKLANSTQKCLVDDKNYELINRYTWYPLSRGNRTHAYTSMDNHMVSMHQLICPSPSPKFVTDHIDGNGLNNQESNLRLATYSQNGANSVKKQAATASSKYKGVSYNKYAHKWQAYIMINYKRIHLGYHDVEMQAAKAYNKAAVEYFGEFAKLNEV